MQEVQQFIQSVGLPNEGLFGWGDDESSTESPVDFQASNLNLQELLGLRNDPGVETALIEGESVPEWTESGDAGDEEHAISSDRAVSDYSILLLNSLKLRSQSPILLSLSR